MGDSWTEQDSRDFIDYGHFFVPYRQVQERIIIDLLETVSPLHKVAELCCGEGRLSNAILKHFAQCQLTGLDGSIKMLEKANKTLKQFHPRYELKAFQLEKSDWIENLDEPQAIVSSLAIHHLDEEEKQALFRSIHQKLRPGGVLVVADIIRPENEAGFKIAASSWDAYVRKVAEREDKAEAWELFEQDHWNYFAYPEDPYDQPSLLKDQLKWFREAGYQGVDVFWLYAGHAIFGGWK